MRVFVDFEASSLGNKSFPVEVGWVFQTGIGESHLIRPAPEWTDWDADAEATHGISRALLERDGEPHKAVARRMMQTLSGHTLYASAPTWDGKWLSLLLRAAGFQRHDLDVLDSDQAFVEAALERLGGDADAGTVSGAVAAARARHEAFPPAHRALADAWREWQIWRTIASM